MIWDETNVSVVAIFGVSGVGKSTLIRRFISDHQDWTHVSAGSLLKNALKAQDRDALALSGKSIIETNQGILVNEFWSEINSTKSNQILFDGHSVVNNGKEIVLVPLQNLREFRFCKIIYVYADAPTILKHRETDSARKRLMLGLREIETEQRLAMSHSQECALQLSIPFVEIESGDLVGFRKAMLV